jgi:hypothetical protein
MLIAVSKIYFSSNPNVIHTTVQKDTAYEISQPLALPS